MQEPYFLTLTLNEIKLIHENQIQLYGGSSAFGTSPLFFPPWKRRAGLINTGRATGSN